MESNMTIDKYGTKDWRNEKGKLHRENGPALIWTDGQKEWWVNGIRHREDGPAVIDPNGNKDYFLNGRFYIKKQYQEEIRKRKLKKLNF